MKHRKHLPIPQWEFGFTPDTFNLAQDTTVDGERIAREREQAEQARTLADNAQARLFPAPADHRP
jgi:hypothetical protein